MRWQIAKGVKVVRWKGGKGERVVRCQDGRFLVLFKGRGCRVGSRFHLFVSDVNERSEEAGSTT